MSCREAEQAAGARMEEALDMLRKEHEEAMRAMRESLEAEMKRSKEKLGEP